MSTSIKSLIIALTLGSSLVAGTAYAADYQANDRAPIVVNNKFVQPALKTVNFTQDGVQVTGKAYGSQDKVSTVYINSNFNSATNSQFIVDGVMVYASSDLTATQINQILENLEIKGSVSNSEVFNQSKEAGYFNSNNNLIK
ncbi:hypothetical protein [Psittacicella gerlachiana]|uniref:Uncharacterized protein n=1 Tax=Psittacicella gerlachiana TaxID=2028574 RepID=A0A3A1Y501_9GAMM|nr:hypothetical protein [Psittacicella gerlachiana]RIY32346.1 hypothetical protein CKF59_07060 [Psittacicella gerlachiana]